MTGMCWASAITAPSGPFWAVAFCLLCQMQPITTHICPGKIDAVKEVPAVDSSWIPQDISRALPSCTC